MARFSKIWYWLVVIAVLILAVGITTLFPQTNDVVVSEETTSPDNTNGVDPPTKTDPQQENSALLSPVVNLDPSIRAEYQQLFNELRKEYLDTRAASIDWWLTLVTIIIGVFAIVLALLGFLGIQEFKRLKTEAERDADEIKDHLSKVLESRAELERVREEAKTSETKTESDEAMQRTRETFSAEEFATLSGDEEFEKVLRDFEQIPNLSFIDKATVDAYKLQKDGKIKEATQKWRSVANIVSGIDENFAARAWGSVGYLLSEQSLVEKAISAYDKAIKMKGDYAEAHYNRGRQKLKSGQYLDAIEDFNKAIDLNFGETKVYVARGVARFELDEHEDAFNDCDKAISMDPDHALAHAVRGDARAQLNDIAGAKIDLQNALELAEEQEEEKLRVIIEKRLQALNETE